jgi:hypothetical protein
MTTKLKATKRMNAKQYREAIAELGLTQTAAAHFLKIGERTSRRFALGGAIPHAVGLLLNLMIAKKVKPEDLA